MPSFLRLSILPLLGCLFLLGSSIWSKREINLRFSGKPAEGQIIGMVLQRGQTADILSAIDTSLVLTLANGERINADYANYELIKPSLLPATKTADDVSASQPTPAIEPDPVTPASADSLSAALRKTVDQVVRGNAEIVRWALLRESRKASDPTRVVRIEKTETMHGYLDVPQVPEVFDLKDGKLLLGKDGVASPYTGKVRIHTVFDVTNAEVLKAQKGDSLIEYSYTRNGETITPGKKDFFLSAEPYSTQFRPVFAFEANDHAVARLSHIGRHGGGATLALRLYGACRVYYDPNHPEEAVVTAIPGPIGDDPLGWFSRACEGLFGQWGSTALIAIAGLLFIVTGLFFISLSLFPPQKIPRPEEGGASAQQAVTLKYSYVRKRWSALSLTRWFGV